MYIKESGGERVPVLFHVTRNRLWYWWEKSFLSCKRILRNPVWIWAKSIYSKWWEVSLWQVNYDSTTFLIPKPAQAGELLCCTNRAIQFSAKNTHLFINYTVTSWWRLFLITARINQDLILTLCFHQTKRTRCRDRPFLTKRLLSTSALHGR